MTGEISQLLKFCYQLLRLVSHFPHRSNACSEVTIYYFNYGLHKKECHINCFFEKYMHILIMAAEDLGGR